MSLTSSIEFETTKHRGDDGYRDGTSPERRQQQQPFYNGPNPRGPPSRVRYPTPDYDQDEDESDELMMDEKMEKIVVYKEIMTTASTTNSDGGENCFTQAPFVFNNSSSSRGTMSPSSSSQHQQPIIGDQQHVSMISSTTTRSTMPAAAASYRTSSSIGEEEGIDIEHIRHVANGLAIGEDDAIDEEEEDDEMNGFAALPKPENPIVDAREPDRFGFLGGTGKEVKIPVDVFRRRESKWLDMLSNWQFFMTKRFDKVRERCRKGIPSSVRPRAWKYLCGAQFFMTSNKTKNIFETLDNHEGDPHWNSEISKDLNRQYPNHELFSQSTAYGKFGQQDLFRVLKAWTLLHPEEGYCQAQAPIAAALLMHMPAHEAFYCFAQICQKYLPGYYSPGLEAIQLDGDILFGLLKKHSYSSYKHLKKQNIDPVLYMVEWFMCAFCRTLPWSCVLRVLDMFMCEGVKILFKVGVFLFKYGLSSREQLNACPSMYETIERLRHLPIENLNEEYLVQKVSELNISDEDLERVHYKQVKARKKKEKQQRSHVTM